MTELVEGVPDVAMAVYAHPDDADIACAGTLARWASAGCRVHLVVCTDGARGTKDSGVVPETLARRRAEEMARSAAVVGLTSSECLGLFDGEVDDGSELRAALVEIIRRVRPEVVFGHDPTAVFFGEHYFNHRDHRMAGWAMLDAVAPAAGMPHYFASAGRPHQVTTVYLSGTLEPNAWVDVGKHLEAKIAAVECHRSQLGGEWAGAVVRQRAEEEGRRAGVRHAEGFRRLQVGG